MEKERRVLFWGAGAAVSIAAVFIFAAIGARAACNEHAIRGWAWAGFFQLFSMSCGNQENWNPDFDANAALDYGIDFAVADGLESGDLAGFVWSYHLGWVCFGASCDFPERGRIVMGRDPNPPPPPPVQSPDARVVWAQFDPQSRTVSGWARIVSFRNQPDGGWIALSCETARGVGNCQAGIQPECMGWCAVFDPGQAALHGWGWSGSDSGTGVGWISFDESFIAEYRPWVRTDFGDLYSRRGFISQDVPPAGEANATYLLTGGGPIDRWITHLPRPAGWPVERLWPDPNFDPLDLPSRLNNYKTAIGSLYIDDLITPVDGTRNRFGHEVVRVNNINDMDGLSLAGKVYHVAGDAIIERPLVFRNGRKVSRDDQALPGGSGLIVIDGRLIVKADVRYEQAVIQNTIDNLASVGWVIRGPDPGPMAPGAGELIGGIDAPVEGPQAALVFDPSVGHFVGLTLIEGIVDTGIDAANPKHLTVAGGLIARGFRFQRTFTDGAGGNKIGSERIVSDGRARTNPPPGFTDIIPALPTFAQIP